MYGLGVALGRPLCTKYKKDIGSTPGRVRRPALPSMKHRSLAEHPEMASSRWEDMFLPDDGGAQGAPHLLLMLAPACLGLALLLCAAAYWAALPKPLPGIPYNEPASRRIMGDYTAMLSAGSRRRWIWSQPRAHGASLSQAFLAPFSRPTVIVSDYRLVADILAHRAHEFDRGTRNKECVGFTAPDFHFTMETRDPRFRGRRETIRNLMSLSFLRTVRHVLGPRAGCRRPPSLMLGPRLQVAAPRAYDSTVLLVQLWSVKQSKAGGRPFSASRDLHLMTLDMITSVAFGFGESRSCLPRELSCIRRHSAPGRGRDGGGPVVFPTAPSDAETEALLETPEMVAIAQASPFPALAQWLALLNPRHARAQWTRRAVLRRQTTACLRKMAAAGDKREAAPESALHHLLHGEKMAAAKAGRKPDFFSAAIRDEVRACPSRCMGTGDDELT